MLEQSSSAPGARETGITSNARLINVNEQSNESSAGPSVQNMFEQLVDQQE